MNPFAIFKSWYAEEFKFSKNIVPDACCLSTIGIDGYPNARFVSLKDVMNQSFILTGPLNSRKGLELKNIPRAALTFWWSSTARQVRIQGDVTEIPEGQADTYFNERNHTSKIVSVISEQGQITNNLSMLHTKFQFMENKLDIKRPEYWGGISVSPVRIEFMEFNMNRLHDRKLFTKEGVGWKLELLQP